MIGGCKNTMNIVKMPYVKTDFGKTTVMDILWGAWVKQVAYDEQLRTYNFEGIYDTIYKDKKSDYPFYISLRVILACQAHPSEYDQTFKVLLDLIDYDAINHLVTQDEMIEVPRGDSPQRWYEDYELKDIEVEEPGYYQLSVLVENQEKQIVPLWVVCPKGITWDEENGTVTEFWAEDFKHVKDQGKL